MLSSPAAPQGLGGADGGPYQGEGQAGAARGPPQGRPQDRHRPERFFLIEAPQGEDDKSSSKQQLAALQEKEEKEKEEPLLLPAAPQPMAQEPPKADVDGSIQISAKSSKGPVASKKDDRSAAGLPPAELQEEHATKQRRGLFACFL